MNEMPKEQLLVVVGAVTNDRGEYLLTQRHEPENPVVHGRWEFPGGTHHFGESLEQTVVRELQEEVGITVAVGTLFAKPAMHIWNYTDRTIQILLVGFHCSYVSGTAKAKEEEIADVRWVKKEDFSQFDFFHTMQSFVDQLS